MNNMTTTIDQHGERSLCVYDLALADIGKLLRPVHITGIKRLNLLNICRVNVMLPHFARLEILYNIRHLSYDSNFSRISV